MDGMFLGRPATPEDVANGEYFTSYDEYVQRNGIPDHERVDTARQAA
jgi:hypothetical protein